MTDVFEIAMERRAALMAEIAEVEDFICKAKSWWKTVDPAQQKNTVPDATPHFAQAARPSALAA